MRVEGKRQREEREREETRTSAIEDLAVRGQAQAQPATAGLGRGFQNLAIPVRRVRRPEDPRDGEHLRAGALESDGLVLAAAQNGREPGPCRELLWTQ